MLIKLLLIVTVLSQIIYPGLIFAASSPWVQTDWIGGAGQSAFSDATKFDSSSNIDFSTTAGQFTLSRTSGWFNSAWSYRKQITFDNSAQAENLVDFPVLITLTSSNFDYSKAKPDGSDLRFADSNGTTSLSYEIEKYDSSGSSLIWVKVPQINASSNTDSIYLYYGNSAASDGQSVNGTWNSNFAMVNHMKESSGINLADSTLNGNNGTKVSATSPNPTTSGKVNGAQSFNGSSDFVTVSDSNSLDLRTSFTISSWVNLTSIPSDCGLANTVIFNKGRDSTSTYAYTLDISQCFGDTGKAQLELYDGSNNPQAKSATILTPDSWYYVVGTYDGANLKIYVNGLIDGTTPTTVDPGNQTSQAAIGRNANNNDRYTNGIIDEVRALNTPLSANWIAASYKSESNTFNTFDSEQGQFSASPGTLTSSIFDSGQASDWGILTYSATAPTNTTAAVKMRSSNSATMVGATAFASCTAITSGSDISSNSCITDGQQYIQYQVTLTSSDLGVSPTFADISTTFAATSTSSGSSSSSTSSSSGPSVCNDTQPTTTPQLNKINSTSSSSTLFINLPEATYNAYAINYGYDTLANNFGAVFTKPPQVGAVEQTIGNLNPGTTYYFKAQLRNGCTAGPWSNILVKNPPRSFSGVPSAEPVPVEQSIPAQSFPANSPIPAPAPTPALTPTPEAFIFVPNLPDYQPLFSDLVSETRSSWFSIFFSLHSFKQDVISGLGSIGNSYQNFQNELATDFNNYFDPEATLITELKASQLGKDYLIITWKTNHPATSKVSYGASHDYGQDVQSAEKVTEHEIKITGLKPNTTYYYEVMSQGKTYVFDARHEVKTLP